MHVNFLKYQLLGSKNNFIMAFLTFGFLSERSRKCRGYNVSLQWQEHVSLRIDISGASSCVTEPPAESVWKSLDS